MSDRALQVAIIGAGPRGLGAAERLVARTVAVRAVAITFLDPEPTPGAGPNFDPRQSPLCLLNVPLHAIDLPAPPGHTDEAGSFSHWLPAGRRDPDRFPPRAELGAYLAARFAALSSGAPAGLRVTHRPLRVERVEADGDGWRLHGDGKLIGRFDEVLLAQGQPRTRPDPQLARWIDHASRTGATLMPAYPDRDLLAAAAGWSGRAVAIRGLGLTTFDVLRLLTLGQGGRFEDGGYIASGAEPARILPFSRDGLPPIPKPATARIDRAFEPQPAETAAFERAMTEAVTAEPERALDLVCAVLVAPACRLLAENGGTADADALRDWLAVERKSPGEQEDREADEVLRHAIAMAEAASPPSPGYAIGQLWRKWQNPLRRAFNPAEVPPETAAALIGFDEGLKRFSYGPPVSGARELLALIETGLVDLRAADDPDVLLVEDGWQLVEDEAQARATVMIDAVLPGPKLETVIDPLLCNLRDEGRICPVDSKSGARTLSDGQVIGQDGTVQRGLSLLGRLALGSVIAVDSIHDCFGEASGRWAEGVLRRADGPPDDLPPAARAGIAE
ncbi:FAD/NAD(P)-binding protein [Rhizobiaceae bacterium BDR2-2]|uniref:FAD/NAD(P)-binding protein n=1 Tax=Ectorhizobium quercum TaxID=2965071 RepID=A0AAE3SWF4_9HYPH|nr:FAD/NAD(P)-binding domain-containing protein [Ectorhizobium quercum]MCX8997390.1 FAD/NAD(P)-binding protein [Ectorhizobium quercum]